MSGRFASIAAMLLATALGCCPTGPAGASTPAPSPDEGRQLIFADEFDAPQLDRSKWNVIGPDSWVNNEQQAYIDDPSVVGIIDGIEGAERGALMLRALYRPGIDPKSERNAPFVSGRIDTRDKFDFTHGRAEARIRMPDAEGVWPAFWLLGNGRWPDTGEIDIMEYVGETDWIGVALHGPGYSGETPLVNKYFFPDGVDVTSWHDYAVEWTDDTILFEVDGQLIYRVTRPMVEHYGAWRFDNPKHVILNFAMGGAYPIKTNGIDKPYNGVPQSTVDKAEKGELAMLVDWVRVYGPR